MLLEGKLVALLTASSEVRALYAQRYGQQVSVISSQMAGRAISRPANLKVLTTTSLYGNGSSQYNRLRLHASAHAELSQDVEWHELERTIGYGTYHLSTETLKALRVVCERAYGARRIPNRFGEGASPRLRQTREGLTALGIDSAQILHHATPRLSYGCELHTGAIEELLGLRGQTAGGSNSIHAIARAWKRRWLFGRIHQPAVLDRLALCDARTVKADMLVPDGNGQLEIVL